MAEAAVEQVKEQPKLAGNLVTSENLAEFNRVRLGLKADPEPEKKAEPEAKAEEKPAKVDEDQTPEEKHEKRKQNSFSERLSELTGARKAAEQREAEAKAEAARLKAELDALQKAQKPDERPDPNKFKDAVEYAEALAEWKVKETLKKRDEEDFNRRQAAESARMQKEWASKIRKTTADLDDYQEVIAGEGPQAPIQFLQTIQPLIFESDVGPRIMYYLNKHPEELDEMVELSKTQLVKRFIKLEEKMESELEGKKETPKPVRKTPEAPEPINPVSGAGVKPLSGIIDANGRVTGDFQQYKAERRAGRIK